MIEGPEKASADQRLNELFPCQSAPSEPPHELLRLLSDALSDLDPVGPEYTGDDPLRRFEKAIFDGARRKNFVQNQRLNWVSDRFSLEKVVLMTLQSETFPARAILDHLEKLKTERLKKLPIVTISTRLKPDQLIAKGYVFVRLHERIIFLDPRGTTYEYAICGREWASFLVNSESLSAKATKIVRNCLQEGRVLAVEATSTGDLLVHPEDWAASRRITKDQKHAFVLTRDLPDSWFFGNLGPREIEARKSKKEALAWLNKEYAQVVPTGKKATKSDAFVQLQKRFGITSQSLLNEIWREAEIPLWRKGGAPGKSKYSFDN